jgi:N utilization substance protein B
MKSAARLYAVQALFQMEAFGPDARCVRKEFETHRFGASTTARRWPRAIRTSSATLEDAVNWQARIDQMTDRALVAKWPIDRIDPTLRALFRAAGAELSEGDTPPKVVITEYVDVAALLPRGARAEIRQRRARPHGARGETPEAF